LRDDRGENTALCRTVQLGDNQPGQRQGVVERLDLRERILANLQNVDETLAQRVADGLNLPLPKASDPGVAPIDLDAAPALRIVGKDPETLKGRKVAILVADGSDGSVVDAVRAAVEGDGGKNFGVLVLHAPDAGKVVIAIGPDGGVGRAVQRAAGVVVNDGLVVEIDDVERAVGADAVFDGAEPQIGAANKFRFFAAFFFFDAVAHTIAADELVVDDVERGLAGEVAVIPFFRPGAAFVNRATRGGGAVQGPRMLQSRAEERP
jgi:hypothetical protein